ncbi:MAG: type II secretion system protein [Elusimicrobiota bacterium]
MGWRKRARAFTLVELMIVIAILGILGSIAIPKFADLIRKSNEGKTKGNLGAIRSALNIYYADNEGYYPTGAAQTNTTFLQESLTLNTKYLGKWPEAHAPNYHPAIATVDTLNNGDAMAADSSDDGEWVYVSNSADPNWGLIMMECYHTDTTGKVWTTY